MDNNLKNQIIKEKIKETPDSILYIYTNIPFRPFFINNNPISQWNEFSLLKIFNKNQLIKQWDSIINVWVYFKYKNNIWNESIGIISFDYDALNSIDVAKFKIGNCNEAQNWQYYTKIYSNKFNSICLMGNVKMQNVKYKLLTKIEKNIKVYPNILGIPSQIWFVNLTIPIMFSIFILLFSLGFYFFRKKFTLWRSL